MDNLVKRLPDIEEETGFDHIDRLNKEIDKYNALIVMSEIENNMIDLSVYTACRDSLRVHRNKMLAEATRGNLLPKPACVPHWNPEYMG